MESSLKQFTVALFSLILFLYSCGYTYGTVTLSPSGDSVVCSGDRLNLTCSLTGSNILEWTFAPATIFMGLYRAIEANAPKNSDDSSMIGSSRFTFSKNSARGNLPLVSTLLIDPVTIDLNGIVINCTGVSLLESATSIVYVVNRHSDEVNKTELFGTEGVTVTFQWPQEYPYNISIIPYLPIYLSENNTNVHLKFNVFYNTVYNVTIASLDQCGQNLNYKLHYAMCPDPVTWIVDRSITLTVIDYESPALQLQGYNITANFSCSHGEIFNGSNIITLTCTRDGIWEPDPKGVNCAIDDDVMITRQMITSSNSPHFQITNIQNLVGSSVGVLLFLITVITIIIVTVAFLLKKRIEGSIKRNTQLECCSVDAGNEPSQTHGHNCSEFATGGVVYADIGHMSLQQHQRPSIPILDITTPIEYATINHHSVSKKKSVSAPLTTIKSTVNDQLNDDPLSVNLDSLLIQLRSQVMPKWYEFGIAAGIEKEVLDKFAKQCSPEDCIVEMLDYWLRRNEKPTWREVAKILRSIHLPKLAQDIKGVYTTGKLPVKINIEDWIPQLQDNECEAESLALPSPIPPKNSVIEIPLSHPENLKVKPEYDPVQEFVESQLNSAPTLPPKPASRPP